MLNIKKELLVFFCACLTGVNVRAGYYEYIKGVRSGYDLNAVPNLKLGER